MPRLNVLLSGLSSRASWAEVRDGFVRARLAVLLSSSPFRFPSFSALLLPLALEVTVVLPPAAAELAKRLAAPDPVFSRELLREVQAAAEQDPRLGVLWLLPQDELAAVVRLSDLLGPARVLEELYAAPVERSGAPLPLGLLELGAASGQLSAAVGMSLSLLHAHSEFPSCDLAGYAAFLERAVLSPVPVKDIWEVVSLFAPTVPSRVRDLVLDLLLRGLYLSEARDAADAALEVGLSPSQLEVFVPLVSECPDPFVLAASLSSL